MFVAAALGLAAQDTEVAPELRVGVVLDGPINVRDKLPSLERRAFLKWEWDFGKIVDTLSTGQEVSVLDTTAIAKNHIWAHIAYRKNGDLHTGYVYASTRDGRKYLDISEPNQSTDKRTLGGAFVGVGAPSNSKSNFLHTAFADEALFSEESSPELSMQSIEFRIDLMILTIWCFSQSFCIFRFFPIKSDQNKIHVFYVLNIVTLVVWGFVRGDALLTLFQCWKGG